MWGGVPHDCASTLDSIAKDNSCSHSFSRYDIAIQFLQVFYTFCKFHVESIVTWMRMLMPHLEFMNHVLV